MSVRQGVRQERNENPTRKTTTGRKGTTTGINKRGGTSCGGIDPRNHIWEVRSKASMPEMTKKPFKAFLHRKAAQVLRFFQTARACKEASSIFDLDERACFNFWIIRCVVKHLFFAKSEFRLNPFFVGAGRIKAFYFIRFRSCFLIAIRIFNSF